MKNYYMPDSVLVIGNEDKAEYWTGDQAAPYLEAYEENMQSFGYTRVATKAEAALGLQISYVQSTQYFVGYSYPYWWCRVTVAGSSAVADETLFWVKMASRSGSEPMSKVTCRTIEPSLAEVACM